MSRTLPRRPALAGTALLLALGLAACGGSDPSVPATAAAGSAVACFAHVTNTTGTAAAGRVSRHRPP